MKIAWLAAGVVAAAALTAHGQVKISQVHTWSSVYANDFVELYNTGASAVNLSGWSVQYTGPAGNTWDMTPLTGTIPAHAHYLVALSAAAGLMPLPTPNDSGTTQMNPSGGKVFLVTDGGPLSGHCPNVDRVTDYVLWGNAVCSVPTAPELSSPTAIFRLGGGCVDSDDCSADFVSGDPAPRNSSVSHPCAGAPDCNGNGIADSTELASGALTDVNGNGVPDVCEGAVVIEAPLSATVQNQGVMVTASSFQVQGTAEDNNGRVNPCYAAARWSNAAFKNVFDARFGPGRWSVKSMQLLTRLEFPANGGGQFTMYYTNNDTQPLNTGNTTTLFPNFATDFADRQAAEVPIGFAGGGAGLDYTVGAYLANRPDNLPGGIAAANELIAGVGSLTLILYPQTSDVLADFAGSTNPSWAGPTLVVFAQESCGSADFNCDGDVGTDADIESFFACLAGNCPPAPCTSSADFNADGDVGTDADIEAFFRVLAGGTC